MYSALTALGVSPELQAFLNITGPGFSYGNDLEYFEPGFHLVPTTEYTWSAGNDTASELIISSSVIESAAYLALNSYRYRSLLSLSMIALGNLPHRHQVDQIRKACQKRKITLVFSNDLTGRLADITVAAGIRNKAVRLRWDDGLVVVETADRSFSAEPEQLTLNTFEKASGIRTGIRTRKPNLHNTYLDQLRYDNQ